MKTSEVNLFRNRILLVLGALLIAITLFTMIISKSYNTPESKIMKSLNKEENMTLLLYDSKNNDNAVLEFLDNEGVNYLIVDPNKIGDYEKVLEKLQLTREIQLPIIVCVEKGENIGYIDNVSRDNSQAIEFIKYHKLNGSVE